MKFKADFKAVLQEVTDRYTKNVKELLEAKGVSDLAELSLEEQAELLKEADEKSFTKDEDDEDEIDEECGKKKLQEAMEVVKSLAAKSNTSEEEVESKWHEAKRIADEQGHEEPEYVVGVLKRMLKINESEGEEDDEEYHFECYKSKLVALNALYMATQLHLYHLNTTSYAQHMALKEFYEELEDLADELAEKILALGYDLSLDETNSYTAEFHLTNDNMLETIHAFRYIVSDGIESTADEDHASLNDVMIDMQKLIDDTLYKLGLQ